jgi:hypothetical protein
MTHRFAFVLVSLVALGGALSTGSYAHAQTAEVRTYAEFSTVKSTALDGAATSRVAYASVQNTPQYDLRRPEVPSGARLTLFANFLGDRQGMVLLQLNGTSLPCQIVQWKPESVTIELPCLGLTAPKNAEIAIILPDGRQLKLFRVLYVPQPDILVHGETVPLPTPPAPVTSSATYSGNASVGLPLYGN